MFTAAKLFFGTPLGKDILGITAILLLLTGVFMAGDYHGHSAGFADGQKQGVASMQPQITELKATVATLTKKINDDTKAQNDKIEKIQTDLSNATIAAEKAKAESKAERQAIVDQYKILHRML